MTDRPYYITIHEYDDNGRQHLLVQQYLTEDEFNDLYGYFMECADEQLNSLVHRRDGVTYIHVHNTKEQLEDSPLPDGCIIYTSEFGTGEHLITLGERWAESL